MITRAAAGLLLVGLLVPATSAAAAPTTARWHAAMPAGNRAATRTEVHRLLGLAPLPPGARRIDHAPAPLRNGPIMGEPAGPALVAQHRFFRVSMSFRRAGRWIAHHHVRGLTSSGSGVYGSNVGVLARGVSFADRDSAAWTQAELAVSVARGAHGTSVWRVDALALWLDPRPVRDTYRGARARVTAATGCPASDRHRHDVRNAGARLDHMMLPPGRVTRVLLCSYHGLNGTAFALRAQRRYGPKVAAQLARRLRAMSLSHVDGAIHSCPLDHGSADIVDFGFAGRPDVDVWVHDTGCGSVDNGHIVGGDAIGGAVRRLLR